MKCELNGRSGQRLMQAEHRLFVTTGGSGFIGRSGKKMDGKKCGEQESPSFTAHIFAECEDGFLVVCFVFV